MEASELGDRARIWTLREDPDNLGDPLPDIHDFDPMPEAVFCSSDIHAIPLAGYDNTTVAGYPLINMTSVD